jgi:Beta/Gamma crystallin
MTRAMRAWLLLLSVAVGACAERANRVATSISAPNPDGCYVQVWDAPNYRGEMDYFNGPGQYPDLRKLPDGDDWNERIRSVKVGPRAYANAYTGTNYSGNGFMFRQDTIHPRLPDHISGQIKSLSVRCITQAD